MRLTSATDWPRAWLLLGLLAGAFVAAGCGSSADSDGPFDGTATAGSGTAGSGTAGDGVGGSSGASFGGSSGSAAIAGASGSGGSSSGGAGGGGSVGSAGSAGSSNGGANGGSAGSSSGGANGGSAGSSSGGANGGSAGSSSGGANGGSAGSGGGATTNTDYLKTHADSYGFVDIAVSGKNQILSFNTTLTVPAKPKANTGTLFLWPGLQPASAGANFDPIDNGVLQPVLTWGGTCAPNAPSNAYSSWWISGQYVNTYGSYTGYTGCLGGPGMNVAVGDALQLKMSLSGTIWTQVVTDATTNKSVSFDLDMLGQSQNYAEFVIEQYTQDPAMDVIFTDSTITFKNAEAAACQPIVRGINDFFTNPKASSDGKQCTIDRVVLRAKGIAATSPN